jgi:ATP-dependent DNA helicase RecG
MRGGRDRRRLDLSPWGAKLLSAMIAGRRSRRFGEAEFWTRYGDVEHEALEFKASANHLREVIPAMAMTAGGQIVLGVSDERRLVGCALDQRTLDAIMRRAQEAEVDVDVEPIVVGHVPLTVVTVPRVRDRLVTTADGRLLRRVGSDNVPLRGEELARFVRVRALPLSRLVGRLAAIIVSPAR